MINRHALLSDLQSLLKRLEADLLERSESSQVPEVGKTLRAEYDRAKTAQRTAQNYEDWRSDYLTQMAAAWVLSCVFVRFLEDNRLIDPPRISGQQSAVSGRQEGKAESRSLTADSSSRLQRARDEHELYFRAHPKQTDREYLLSVFDALAELPGTRDVFGPHNPLRELPNWLSGDAAGELLRFFQKIDANTGVLVHDFASGQQSAFSGQPEKAEGRPLNADGYLDTRFLGDLYQDLSEAARKKYALLQTPEFVEEFILDRTLDPALDEFGLNGQGAQPPVSGSRPSTLDSRPGFKMIDPACGSGHFLLGSFRRILDRWQKQEPGTNVRELVQRTLDSIHGVDVNPYAVAIARFRLLLAAMRACGIQRLADAPGFTMHLACGDSLLHAPLRASASEGQAVFDWELTGGDAECEHAYHGEDLPALKQMLRPGTYHAVVANPPYIVPKDRQLNERYRLRFVSCHMKYSLAVPFMEMLFRLAYRSRSRQTLDERADEGQTLASSATPEARSRSRQTLDDGGNGPNSGEFGYSRLDASPNSGEFGYVGQITANSFMKREFGKKLIETFLPRIDLTHVIDTSGAYIPGHGTPTVVLFGRNRAPVAGTIRAVMGIRGEPSTPDDPSQGLVWSAIVGQIDRPGSQSEFVSVTDSARERFHSHPWSIGGGGAAELKERLEEAAKAELSTLANSIGITSFTLEDDVYILPETAARRSGLRSGDFRTMVVGDALRDRIQAECEVAVFPYDADFRPIVEDNSHRSQRYLWMARTCLANNKMFGGKTKVQTGLAWYEYGRLTSDKLRTPLSIVYGEVATHNHFVLDRGGKVFKQTAPVIKLPAGASEDDHLVLLGLLNSSTACFWMKQVCHQKQMMGGDGIRIESKAKVPYAFNATALGKLPIPDAWCEGPLRERLLEMTRRMDKVSDAYAALTADAIVAHGELSATAIREQWDEARKQRAKLRSEQVFLQEEIDFTVYRMFDLVTDDLLSMSLAFTGEPLTAGDRPFCIVAARNEEGFPVPESVLTSWPKELRDSWQRRIDVIRTDRELRLVESSMYKRRWIGRQGLFNHQRSDNELGDAAKAWLTNRLESYFDFDGRMNGDGSPTSQLDIGLTSVARLSDIARSDKEFIDVGEVYRDDAAFDILRLVEELIRPNHVPLLPILCYKPSGLRKRQEWEKTWELQRAEDVRSARSRSRQTLDDREEDGQTLASSATGVSSATHIPVPPKYKSSDFISTGGARYWALRGKLDVPKERWVSFPHCEGPDGTLVIAWAGYDHLQLARAISAWYVEVQERLGGRDDPRLIPLLACLIELLPWLKQWHNEVDPEYGLSMGDYFEGFVQEEARNLPRPDGGTGWTLDEIRGWEPPKRTQRRSKANKS